MDWLFNLLHSVLWGVQRSYVNLRCKRENLPKNLPLFKTLNAYILRTGYARNINEPILKCSHQRISYEDIVKFLISS